MTSKDRGDWPPGWADKPCRHATIEEATACQMCWQRADAAAAGAAPGYRCEAFGQSIASAVTNAGDIHTFASGAKSSEVKPRYDLIPTEAVRREAQRFAEGAATHGPRNWQKGVSDPTFITDRLNHLIEHAMRYANGDRSEDHLAGVRANAAILMWLEEHAPSALAVGQP